MADPKRNMPAPDRGRERPRAEREESRPPFRGPRLEKPAAGPRFAAPHGISGEAGWLPDCVYTGEKFESGVAFFADAMGRISRFSREPADLAAARRLAGQAALPGLVNAHSHAFHRVLRGRTEQRGRSEGPSPWLQAHDRAMAGLTGEDVFDVARMVFVEMLLSGITCVGEFHYLHHQPDGSPWPEPNFLAREVARAAHDVGIRIALLKVAWTRADFRAAPGSGPARSRAPAIDSFLRDAEGLRAGLATDYPTDEVWAGIGAHSLAAVPLDQVKAIAAYAHTQRLRLHVQVSRTPEENAACVAEYGRTPVALLADHGIVDKRFTAVDVLQLSDEEVRLLGTARASVCVCPVAASNHALGRAPVEKLLAAGAGLALGTDSHDQIDLMEDARVLEYGLRGGTLQRPALGPDAAAILFHAATFTGARSLGATGGALEVGRPADFFTVNLYEPSLAGADAGSLLANIVFALERRAIREVWVGARQRIANGRHVSQGAIVGRFVDLQKRLWAQA